MSKDVAAELKSHFRRRSNRSLNTQSSGNLHAIKSSRNTVIITNGGKLLPNRNAKQDAGQSHVATPSLLYGETLSR